jgi:hypothetical protein
VRGTSGAIQSGITPVDLQSDLGIRQNHPQFAGKLVVKPARRHRLLIEGAPYRLTGEADAFRQITFAGRTYTLQEHLVSTADITYIAGAYQFDLISRDRGHFGLQGGVAWVDSEGTVSGRSAGFATERQSFPIPLAGAEGRVWLIPGSRLLNLNGEIQGMSLGDYGRFLQAGINCGVGLGRHVTLEAGYRIVDAIIHRRDETRGFSPRFTGWIFSLQVRD